MAIDSNVLQEVVDALKQDPEIKNNVYQAAVSRIDGEGVVWVNIAGSDTETPTAITSAEVAPGDSVNVEWRNNKLYIGGNYSNPSAGVGRVAIVEELANNAVTDAVRARTAADSAEASAEEAKATADSVHDIAVQAQTEAEAASTAASAASTAAAAASTQAQAASTAAAAASTQAQAASTAAGNAQTAAESAQGSADSALVGLSTVQDVVGVLNWITAHGTMTSQSGGTFDPDQVYFVMDDSTPGDYHVGSHYYSIVSEPKAADINSYYVLTVDESVQNYVATHIVVDSEGLWIIPDAGGNKVLIATGSGSTYTTAGTYIVGKVNGVDAVFAKFTADGATMQRGSTNIAHLGYGPGNNSSGGTSNAPYYTLGTRDTEAVIGNLSVSEGSSTAASAYTSHAEGYFTRASGNGSHAEGYGDQVLYDYDYSIQATGTGAHAEGYAGINGAFRPILASGNGSHAEGYASSGGVTASGTGAHAEGTGTTASGNFSHAEGSSTTAVGSSSHAQNYATKAGYNYQTAIGQYNDNQSTSAFEIGNGTADNARSNALTVDWSGNLEAAGDIADGAGNVLSDKLQEDSNGDLTVTHDITAGHEITDGYGNVLSNIADHAVFEDANGDAAITRNITAGGNVEATGGGVFGDNISISHGVANTTAMCNVKRTDTGVETWLGVGSGGANHGVYSETSGRWIIYDDNSNITRIPASDIRLKGHSTSIGSRLAGDGTATCSNSTNISKIADLTTLPAGSWLVTCSVRFPANSTGTRGAQLMDGTSNRGVSYCAGGPASGLIAFCCVENFVSSSSIDLNLAARQNSGSSMTVTYYWSAIRIA